MPKLGWTNNEIYSIWKYEGIIRLAILALKYKFASEIASELAEACLTQIKTLNTIYNSQYTILIPVPLHKLRQNWRGFNQAEEIGKIIARNMDWEFSPDLIIKAKASEPQAELTRGERLRNLHGKFAVNNKVYSLVPNNYCLVVFDDVATTGSTIKEIAKVLIDNGAKKVIGLTIAS